ncbi:hypothetical protein AL035_19935, partial [Salipiger aestuarii]|uniref:bifunctional hydroxymethylpyrimidine kinase/phosphomethylpyrimidine kinase n=1 Tax=Salipiger aestuarii TaxID=568098 RepID=UPI0014793182
LTGMAAHPCIAVTAVTAQDDAGVQAVHPVPPDVVAAQIRAAGRVDAIKLGMLVNADTIGAVAAALPRAPLVIDPVLRSSSGAALLDDAGLGALLSLLVPRATVLTPNLPELAAIADRDGAPDHSAARRALFARGCKALLVKGGHAPDRDFCEDRLYLPDGTMRRFRGPRLAGTLRGTGCQLGSALAVALAGGAALPDAVARARDGVARRFATQA